MSRFRDAEESVAVDRARAALAAVTVAYVAVTVGESVLAPMLPVLASEIGLDTASAGMTLGVLSLAAALGNLIGGALLVRFSARTTSLLGTSLSIAGSVAVATTLGGELFIASHLLIGLGAGIFFAGGVFSVGVLAPPGRTGRTMGRYGIAYSVALALAALLVSTLGSDNWRGVYVVSALLGAVAMVLLLFVKLPSAQLVRMSGVRQSARLLRVPILVGGVAAVAQFGLVAYVPAYAVSQWSVSASTAALILVVGRVLSIPGKTIAGWMIDRFGARSASRLMGVVLVATGLLWLLVPVVAVAALAAVLFASAAGAMFPMANVVALERFGEVAGLLGVFRSAQMAIAGVSAWLVGNAAAAFGMRQALVVGVLTLIVIFLLNPVSEDDEANRMIEDSR